MPDYIEELNESQRAAVLYGDGPSLVIAGAGSGKTRVLTYKIAYLLENGYNPWNMLVHSGYREQFWNSSQSLIGLTQDFGSLWEPLEGLTGNFKFSWDAWNTTIQRRSKRTNPVSCNRKR